MGAIGTPDKLSNKDLGVAFDDATASTRSKFKDMAMKTGMPDGMAEKLSGLVTSYIDTDELKQELNDMMSLFADFKDMLSTLFTDPENREWLSGVLPDGAMDAVDNVLSSIKETFDIGNDPAPGAGSVPS